MTTLRPSRPGDEDALRRLWQTVFADEDSFLELFFREIYVPGMAAVAETEGEIVSAAYAVPFGEAAYIYAVATHPAHRGRGHGRAVTLAAARGKGAYLHPAEESLSRWYERSMGAVPVSFRGEMTPPPGLRPISAAEYARRREALLAGVPHARYSPGILRLFALNGGFYAWGEKGVCALGGDGSVQELLPCPAGGEAYIYALNGAPALYWGLTLE